MSGLSQQVVQSWTSRKTHVSSSVLFAAFTNYRNVGSGLFENCPSTEGGTETALLSLTIVLPKLTTGLQPQPHSLVSLPHLTRLTTRHCSPGGTQVVRFRLKFFSDNFPTLLTSTSLSIDEVCCLLLFVCLFSLKTSSLKGQYSDP